MKRLSDFFSGIDRLSANAATVIAVGCEVSLMLSIAAVMMINADYFAALDLAVAGLKLLSVAVTASLVWDLSKQRSGDQNDAT